MEVFVQDIYFSYEESSYFGELPKIIPTFAHVSYLIIGKDIELKGNVDIEFNKYKEMKHNDIIDLIISEIKKVKLD